MIILFLFVYQVFGLCPVGYFNVTTPCQECPAGFYSDTTNATTCIICPVNTFSLAGASVCQNCSIGSDTRGNQGSPFCVTCQAGSFNNISGGSCTPCSLGLVSGPNSSECQNCSVGKENVIKNISGGVIGFMVDNCNPCYPGWYNPFNGSQCIKCPQGTFSSTFGSTNCTFCGPGSYSPNDGSSICEDCPAGTFSNGTGPCLPCENSTFSGTGNSVCTQCPDVSRVLPGYGAAIIAILSFLLLTSILIIIMICYVGERSRIKRK